MRYVDGITYPQERNMEHAPLLLMNNGRTIPQLALGTFLGWDAGGPVVSNGELSQAIEVAIRGGYRHVDTAAVYRTEDEVGLGIASCIDAGVVTRDDVFITTKLWNDRHGRAQVVPALRESLARLRLDRVDLFLVHWPMAYSVDQKPLDIDIVETWRGMEEAVALGLASSIGLSNFNESQTRRILENALVPPAVLQIEVSASFSNESLVQYALRAGLAVMAYCPLGGLVPRAGLVTSEADVATLRPIADAHGKTVPQIAIRYLVERGLIPVVKSINSKRVAENLDVFDFRLSPEEMRLVSALDRGSKIVLPAFWQNHNEYPFEKVDDAGDNPFEAIKK